MTEGTCCCEHKTTTSLLSLHRNVYSNTDLDMINYSRIIINHDSFHQEVELNNVVLLKKGDLFTVKSI